MKNETEAVKWFQRAAEQGYAQAQYNLGFCYEYGTGVVKNLPEAGKWYQKAIQGGYNVPDDVKRRMKQYLK